MRKTAAVILALVSLLLCACSGVNADDHPFYAMGTYCTVTLYGDGDAAAAESAVRDTENLLSHRVPASAAAKANGGEAVALPAEYAETIAVCEKLQALTHGRFSVLSLALTSLWGFDSEPDSPPSPEDIKAALDKCAGTKIVLFPDGIFRFQLEGEGGIDFGSAGKGAACEAAVKALKESGCTSAVVSVGGSVGVFGTGREGGYRIALRDPFGNESDVNGVFTVSEGYISTSGSYEKCFEYEGKTYHHILDMTTGYPYDGEFVSVTAVSDNGVMSDLLSTACFLLPLEEALEVLNKYGCEGVFILKSGEFIATKGLEGRFEIQKGTVSFR